MNRRDFIELSAAFAAFAAVPSAGAAPGTPKPGPITGVSLARDCAAICTATASIAKEVKSALANQVEIVSLGDLIPSGSQRLTMLLDSKDGKRQALVLGFIIGRAAARGWAPSGAPPEYAVYQDAFLLREIANGHNINSTQSMETLLYTISRRLMIGIHTFEPDAEDIENWILRLADWDERTTSMHHEYAVAFASPDRAKLSKYVESVAFFDRTDPLIRAAAQLREGARLSGSELDASVAARGTSLYGKALRAAVADISVASAYVSRKLDAQGLLRELKFS